MKRMIYITMAVLAPIVLGSGCSRDRMVDLGMARAAITAPQPPLLITTGAALLLTNTQAFTAHADVHGPSHSISGALACRNGKLLFVPGTEKVDKYSPEGRYSFIWDVAKNQGWLLSDALQAFAPVTYSAAGIATNLVTKGVPSAAQGQPVVFTVQLADGKEAQLTAIMNPGTPGLPSQIQSSEPAFRAELKKVSLKAPPASEFEIPEGFARYQSAEALVDEIAARYRTLKRRSY